MKGRIKEGTGGRRKEDTWTTISNRLEESTWERRWRAKKARFFFIFYDTLFDALLVDKGVFV